MFGQLTDIIAGYRVVCVRQSPQGLNADGGLPSAASVKADEQGDDGGG